MRDYDHLRAGALGGERGGLMERKPCGLRDLVAREDE